MTWEELSKDCPWKVSGCCAPLIGNHYIPNCTEANCASYYWVKQGERTRKFSLKKWSEKWKH